MQVIEPALVVEANGIAMRLVQAEVTPSYARFTLCYPKPSPKDWMTGWETRLQAGAYEAGPNGYSLLADDDFDYRGKPLEGITIPDPNEGERCVAVDFLLGHSGPAEGLTLTIPALEQSVPEVIPDAELNTAREKLKAQGIEMEYTSSSSAGGGSGSGPIFQKLPEGMDFQEAHRRLMAALGYVHPGPWVFELDLRQVAP